MYLTVEEIDVLAAGLASLATSGATTAQTAAQAARVVWERADVAGPIACSLATALAEAVANSPHDWPEDGLPVGVHTCGTTLLSVTVAHPIHDGPWPGSGSGRCEYESISYCPRCQQKPSSQGEPIVPPGAGWAK